MRITPRTEESRRPNIAVRDRRALAVTRQESTDAPARYARGTPSGAEASPDGEGAPSCLSVATRPG